jgi:uncharacterized protein YndB with AHSA1/START domain
MTPPEISFEVEVPGTPEQVWDAIATGPGISGWFVQTEIAGDRMTQHHGNGFDRTSRIVASERPRRFKYEDDFRPGPDEEERAVATELLVEARSGGTCVVRLVQSGFGSGSAWERAVESFKGGWPAALDDLRIFLTDFTPGEPVAGFATGVQLAAGESWERVLAALGLPAEHELGERIETGAGTPPLAGTVSRTAGSSLSLLLDAPGRGMGYLGVGGPGAEVFFFVRGRFFGEAAAATAHEASAAWEAWLANANRLPTA